MSVLNTGDWVAVRLEREYSGIRPSTSVQSTAFLHVARITEVLTEDVEYTVSFLKRQKDGGYSWPDQEDTSTVYTSELLKISSPREDIACTSSTIRVKLWFCSDEINTARIKLQVAINRVC